MLLARLCAQIAVSALPRGADIEADILRCPLRATSGRHAMSASPRHLAQFFRYALHSRQAVSIGRSELSVHLEVSQCRLQIAFHLPRYAAVVIGLGLFRIEPDRLVKVRDGPVEVALGA